MSLILALLPIAIAVAGTLYTRKETSEVETGSFLVDTPMKNQTILEQALRDYGCQHIRVGQQVDVTVNTASIMFERNEQGVFTARFTAPIQEDQAKSFVQDLYQLYTQKVQQHVYKKLLARAGERGLQLQSEEIKEDNSVVLTFAL